MEIKVLGTGCSNCKTTVKLVEEIAKEKGASIVAAENGPSRLCLVAPAQPLSIFLAFIFFFFHPEFRFSCFIKQNAISIHP